MSDFLNNIELSDKVIQEAIDYLNKFMETRDVSRLKIAYSIITALYENHVYIKD